MKRVRRNIYVYSVFTNYYTVNIMNSKTPGANDLSLDASLKITFSVTPKHLLLGYSEGCFLK